jgi:hypothetical protein
MIFCYTCNQYVETKFITRVKESYYYEHITRNWDMCTNGHIVKYRLSVTVSPMNNYAGRLQQIQSLMQAGMINQSNAQQSNAQQLLNQQSSMNQSAQISNHQNALLQNLSQQQGLLSNMQMMQSQMGVPKVFIPYETPEKDSILQRIKDKCYNFWVLVFFWN